MLTGYTKQNLYQALSTFSELLPNNATLFTKFISNNKDIFRDKLQENSTI